jgi:hypothetical protein
MPYFSVALLIISRKLTVKHHSLAQAGKPRRSCHRALPITAVAMLYPWLTLHLEYIITATSLLHNDFRIQPLDTMVI